MAVWTLETPTANIAYQKSGTKHCLARLLVFANDPKLKPGQRFKNIQV